MYRAPARLSLIGFIGLFTLFGLCSIWLLANNYVNEFALSRWAKVLGLLGAAEFRLEYLGLSYPHFPVYVLFPFYFIPGLRDMSAPYAASILIAVGLLIAWNRHLRMKGYDRATRALLIVLISAHPYFLWAATTGTNKAFSLVMFYLLYVAIARLVHEQDARAFILLGTVLAAFFFVDERTSYLFIALLPLLPLVAPRRMMSESAASVYVVITAPLIIVFMAWAYLNWVFQDDAWLFLTSPDSVFLGVWYDAPHVDWLRVYGGQLLGSALPIFLIMLTAFPALVWLMYHAVRHAMLFRASFVLFAHLIIAASLATAGYFLAHPVEMLFMLCAGFMAGVVLIPRETTWSRRVMLVLLAVGWVGGWASFFWHPTKEMTRWINALRGVPFEYPYEADARLAKWLYENRGPTMIDDRSGYRVIAQLGETRSLILPYSSTFKLALLRLPLDVAQVAVPNPKRSEGALDHINRRYPAFYEKGTVGYTLVYDRDDWRVYQRVVDDHAGI